MYAMELPKDFTGIAERVMRGEKVLISCPQNDKNNKNEKLIIITEREYNKLEETRRKALERLRINLVTGWEKSVVSNTDKITDEEINSAIAEVRQERAREQERKGAE